MTSYVSRRLSVTDDDNQTCEYSDADFCNLNNILVIIGEPGSGKSELSRAMQHKFGGNIVFAEVVARDQSSLNQGIGQLLIIDGVDEVQNDSSGTTIQDVLTNLSKAGIKQFILTCRAADWAHALNNAYIKRRFNSFPIVGRLLPFNDSEVEQFITSNFQDINYKDFIETAEDHDATELLRNPQTLTLLLNVFQKDGWPATKAELYEKACINLAQEQSETHKSLTPLQLSNEKIMGAAGFIFAQLLLSNLRSIQLDGGAVNGAAKLADLASKQIPETHIRRALSSLLFRVSSNETLEPAHRTIAEFLGAKWITSELENNLSIRRFDTLIYGANHIVPTSLRGLHAWVATLDKSKTNNRLKYDPYGCLRYGDVSQFSVEQVISLLNELKSLAEYDPYFRNEDWDTKFGQGLARKELRTEITSIISNAETPDHLATVVLEGISGSSLAEALFNDLTNILIDDTYSFAQRDSALFAIEKTATAKNWPNIAKLLKNKKSTRSLRFALDIIGNNITHFSGTEIAGIFIDYEKLCNSSDMHFSGVGYQIPNLMSANQLEEALNAFTLELPSNQTSSDFSNIVEEHLLGMLQQYLEKKTPSASLLWQWLCNIQGHSYQHQKWDVFSTSFFNTQENLKQSIQLLALQSDDNSEFELISPYQLSRISNGLLLCENDFIYQLEHLASHHDHLSNWMERWSHLVLCAINRDDFSENVMTLARRQVKSLPMLVPKLDAIINAPVSVWEIDEKAKKDRWLREVQAKTISRHKSYESIISSIQNGKSLDAIDNIAIAYLGRNGELNTAENNKPQLRVKELVGVNNVAAALEGIVKACEQNKIPTPKEIAQASRENQRYKMEPICIARCALCIELGEELNQLSKAILECALAGGRWGQSYIGDKTTTPTLEKVESLIFSDERDKEKFVRDTMELPIEKGDESITGLNKLIRNEQFSDISAGLCYEWLEQYGSMSIQSLSLLLDALIISSPDELVKLVRNKLGKTLPFDHRKCWLSTAFVICFDEFNIDIQAFVKEDKNHLWDISARCTSYNDSSGQVSLLSIEQLAFIVRNFALCWPRVEIPKSSYGSHDPYEAYRYIEGCLSKIGADLSDEASSVLNDLVNSQILGDYSEYAKHLYSQQCRGRAENEHTKISLPDVRYILLSKKPSSIDDLQGFVMDELEYLQKRLQDGQTNGVLPYWDNATPHGENYCRDRIVDGLEERLQRYGIRVHTEGTMPDNRRCDILCTFNEWDLPIEIKGQWHTAVWSAACEQLEDNYSREYRAEGRGVYLVLWFGRMSRKNPPRLRGKAVPESADEMLKLIEELSPRQISEKTKLFVIDVTK